MWNDRHHGVINLGGDVGQKGSGEPFPAPRSRLKSLTPSTRTPRQSIVIGVTQCTLSVQSLLPRRSCVIASPAQQRAIVRATMAVAVDLALAEMAGA